jgi:hypothetical protein
MSNLIWIPDWPVPHGKKKNQMESLPAREVRNSIQARITLPNYDTALAEQNAKRNMIIYRKSILAPTIV